MPPTARKPVAPGVRRVRLALPPCGDEPGVVEITMPDRKGNPATAEYLMFALPVGPVGRGYRLRQYNGPRPGQDYFVLIGHDPTDSTCDCKDCLYRGSGCKHVLALSKLQQEGKLP